MFSMEDETPEPSQSYNTPDTSAPSSLPSYYRDIQAPQLHQAFKNFDDEDNMVELLSAASDIKSNNFVIDFGDEDAYCGFDLDIGAITGLLNSPRPPNLPTRWINIWRPYDQVDILQVLGEHYDFSPRLLAVMCEQPPRPTARKTQATSQASSFFRKNIRRFSEAKSGLDLSIDLEDVGAKAHPSISSVHDDELQGTNHYKMVDDVWHWSSVDWGRKYICVGYNSLHTVRGPEPDRGDAADGDESSRKDLPHGKRVWRWHLLLKDRTVISISENPYPYCFGSLDIYERRQLSSIRGNLVNIFRQLSKSYDVTRQTAITLLPLRKRFGTGAAVQSSDAPSLLFYCLFDDSATTYSLVARRDHQYSVALENLRQQMFLKAELAHIDQLFNIGRQLGVLKRLYQSYDLIIERILNRQTRPVMSMLNSAVQPQDAFGDPLEYSHHPGDAEGNLGVPLSSSAGVRFERLRDRIQLYALSEIQECLDQKESLVMMNFNLIAIKESFSVERLTRITLLLTKITILFLPVTLLTGYFSTQLVDAHFTVKAFWTYFAVVLSASLVAVVAFGVYSGTLEGKIIYRPLSRKVVDIFSKMIKDRRRGST